MSTAAEREGFAELVRTRLAAGSDVEGVIRILRNNEVDKLESAYALHAATGMSVADAQFAVHVSATWSDRREIDEYLQEMFWRTAFILCLIDGGEVTEPAEDAAELRERRTRAIEQLSAIAARLPADQAAECLRRIDDKRLGRAFEELVDIGERRVMDIGYWQAMSDASQTLCLEEAGDLSKADVVRGRVAGR